MRTQPPTIGTLGRPPARPSTPPPVPDPPPERGRLRRGLQLALFDNMGLKFLSMVLAVTVFLLVNTDKDREITAHIGVSYTLPDDKVLVSDRLDEVRVTLKGSWRRLRKFDEREVDRVNLDLRRATSSEVAISSDMIHLPSGLTVTSINPRSVHVAFDKRVDKVVEVVAAIAGRPQHGYVQADVAVIPPTVKVRGGEKLLAGITSVRTREISLEGRTEVFSTDIEVAPPDDVIEVVGSPRVTVVVHINEELVVRKVPALTVVVRGDGDLSRWRVAPAQVDVTLTGFTLAVEKARNSIVPVVKLTPDVRPREVEVTIEGLPPGMGVKVSPERVRLAPIKPAPPPAAPPPPRAP